MTGIFQLSGGLLSDLESKIRQAATQFRLFGFGPCNNSYDASNQSALSMSNDSNLLQFHGRDACVGSLRSFYGRTKGNFKTSHMKVGICLGRSRREMLHKISVLAPTISLLMTSWVKQMSWIQYMTRLVLSSTSRKNMSAAHRTKTRTTTPTICENAPMCLGLAGNPHPIAAHTIYKPDRISAPWTKYSENTILPKVLYRLVEELVRNVSIVSQNQADYKHRAADGLHMRLGLHTKLFRNYGC